MTNPELIREHAIAWWMLQTTEYQWDKYYWYKLNYFTPAFKPSQLTEREIEIIYRKTLSEGLPTTN